MKRKFIYVFALAGLFFGLLAIMVMVCESQAGEIRDGVLRFHIVANSNSEYDQNNKMSVRDGIAQLCSEFFYTADNKADAIQTAQQNSDLIVQKAEEILHTRGSDDAVCVTVRKRFFPTRTYEGVSLPAGVYDTVDVQIGTAEGKNFWCVMFPDICIGASNAVSNKETMSDVLTGGAYDMVTESKNPQVKFRFKVVEIFENIKHMFN